MSIFTQSSTFFKLFVYACVSTVSFLFLCFFLVADANAFGISPIRMQLGTFSQNETQTASVLLLRDVANDPVGDVLIFVSGRSVEPGVFSGNPFVVIPSGAAEVLYSFSVTPSSSMRGTQTLYLDFFSNKNGTVSGSGAVVASGNTIPIKFFVLNSSQIKPNLTGITVVNTETPQIVLTDVTKPVSISVPETVLRPKIDVSSFVSEGKGVIPQIQITSINAGNTAVSIPGSTTVQSSDASWDGVISAPSPIEVTFVSNVSEQKTVSMAISVGYEGGTLTFDKAVRLLLPNQAGKRIGYGQNSSSFTEIVAACGEDSQNAGNALSPEAECKIDVGADLVVWTKHFTQFATYTQSAVSNGSSSSSSGSSGGTVTQGGVPASVPVVLPAIALPTVQELMIMKPKDYTVSEAPVSEVSAQQEKIKEILYPSLVFSQPKKDFPKQLVITHKNKKKDEVTFDPSLKKPIIASDTHTAEYRYYKTHSVHLKFDSFPLQPKFDAFYYTISSSPTVYVSELQSVTHNSEINIDLSDGMYYVHVAGRRDGVLSAPQTRKILIDSTSPQVLKKQLVLEQKIFQKSRYLLHVSLFDQTSGIAYGKWITPQGSRVFVTDAVPLRFLKKENQTYQLAVTDVAGNVYVEDLNFRVEYETSWETIRRLWKRIMMWIRI